MEGSTAAEYVAWFQRMRMSLPALVNLAPHVDATCEATLRAEPSMAALFNELDNKRYAPGYLEKPLVKSFRELTMRGPAEVGRRGSKKGKGREGKEGGGEGDQASIGRGAGMSTPFMK